MNIKKFNFKYMVENENTDAFDNVDNDDNNINTNQKNEYVELHLSNKLIEYLLELKNNKSNNNFEIGDKLYLNAKSITKNKLNDNAFNFLSQRNVFEIFKINKSEKLDLGYYTISTNNENKKIKKTFYFNKNRFFNLKRLNKISSFLMGLMYIKKDMLLDNYVDYFDVDNKGNISYLPSRYFEEGNHYNSNRRQTTRIGRLLNRIVKPEFLTNISQRDIEMFSNDWTSLFDDSYTLEILEGDDILNAYNFKMLSGGWNSSSCANSDNPDKKTFSVYIQNTENIKCLIVKHKGKIYGRRMLFTGIQTQDHGTFKKGQNYTVLNNPFCEGGYDSKIDKMMKRWATDNNAILVSEIKYGDKNDPNIFRIRLKETCFNIYPPFDSMFVNMFSNELSYGGNIRQQDKDTKISKYWFTAYKASCNLNKTEISEKQEYLKKIKDYDYTETNNTYIDQAESELDQFIPENNNNNSINNFINFFKFKK